MYESLLTARQEYGAILIHFLVVAHAVLPLIHSHDSTAARS